MKNTFRIMLLAVLLGGCSSAVCHVAYRDDGKTAPQHNRFYAVAVCETILCESATPLPDPATMTGGCR